MTEVHGLKKESVKDVCQRELDDFCPRRQLEKMIESCGEPVLDIRETKESDGSISLEVVDQNDSLTKCIAKLDNFVMCYSGEDLRNATEKEVKRRYDLKIKSTISKLSAASSRAVEKSKTVDDIDWDKKIADNHIDKLYVSQLHLYMMKIMGMTKAQCEAKGYNKAKKIEHIKQHFYSSKSSNYLPSKTQPPSSNYKPSTPLTQHPQARPPPTITISFPRPTQSPTSVLQHIRVPPWGGTVLNGSTGVRQLINTCPIDNFLTIFFVLLSENGLLYQRLLGSVEGYAQHLIQIKHLFDRGEFSNGKMLWLSLFPPGHFNFSSPVLDLWRNEEDLFMSRIQAEVMSVYKGSCSSPCCPSKIKQLKSHSICLR